MIESLYNPKIKYALKLFDKRSRDKEGKFIIEGYRELLRAAEAGQEIEHLFYCPEFFLQDNEKKLISLIEKKAAIYQTTKQVFQRLSFRDRPDGLFAVAIKKNPSLLEIEKNFSKVPLIVIAESIEKPGNLGTILRSCDGAGVDGLIVCDRCTDIYNPNVVRASIGTLFTVPTVEADKKQTIEFIQKHHLQSAAASPQAKEKYTEIDLNKPTAIVVGSEQYGLSKDWFDLVDQTVHIPMKGIADSLNVAQATTLLVYEAQRQRDRDTLS